MKKIVKKLDKEELHLMTVFWNNGVPMTVRQATKVMNEYYGVFYTDQMTAVLIGRMMRKGHLEKQRCGKVFCFLPRLSKLTYYGTLRQKLQKYDADADLFPFYYGGENRISEEKRKRIKKLIDELED